MFSDGDHEVIDSPEALFRHLYEEHGVEEARDLDPATAPLQFWLRRHAELERDQRATGGPPDPPREPPAQRRQPAGGGREGRRHAGFGDPLVEAVARALAGRGHDEAAVRSAIRSFAPGPGPAGEAAVRTAFVEPMLQSVAERLLHDPGPQQPTPNPRPAAGAATTRSPAPPSAEPAREEPARPSTREEPVQPEPGGSEPGGSEPVRPEAAWAVLWADLADTGRRPGEGHGAGGEDGDDLMAVANAVQTRQRVRLLRR
jgi:hypothetical protein